MSDRLIIGDLDFALQRSLRRKTIGITVERDGSLTITAPASCTESAIRKTAEKKRFWVYTKLAKKEMLFRPQEAKEYVTGEGFHYLGRTYRLKLLRGPKADVAPLRLYQGRFLLRSDQRSSAKSHFVDWYIQHGRSFITPKVERFAQRVGVKATGVEVRELGYRWGSCRKNGVIQLHWRVAQLPPPIIDYVIVHELIHLLHPHHTETFWRRLARTMPDFGERRRWLAEQGHRY